MAEVNLTKQDLVEVLKTFETSIKNHIDTKVDELSLSTAKGFEEVHFSMASKKDLALTEFHLQTQLNGIEVDLKSFKEEVRTNAN